MKTLTLPRYGSRCTGVSSTRHHHQRTSRRQYHYPMLLPGVPLLYAALQVLCEIYWFRASRASGVLSSRVCACVLTYTRTRTHSHTHTHADTCNVHTQTQTQTRARAHTHTHTKLEARNRAETRNSIKMRRVRTMGYCRIIRPSFVNTNILTPSSSSIECLGASIISTVTCTMTCTSTCLDIIIRSPRLRSLLFFGFHRFGKEAAVSSVSDLLQHHVAHILF
jgi:hypothetical protein